MGADVALWPVCLSETGDAGVRVSSELLRAAESWPGCSSELSGSAGETGRPAWGGMFVCAPIWVPVDLGRGGGACGFSQGPGACLEALWVTEAGLQGWNPSPVTIRSGLGLMCQR